MILVLLLMISTYLLEKRVIKYEKVDNITKNYNIIWIDTIQKDIIYQDLGRNHFLNYDSWDHQIKDGQITLSKVNTQEIVENDFFYHLSFWFLIGSIIILITTIIVELVSDDYVFFDHIRVYNGALSKCIEIIYDGNKYNCIIRGRLVKSLSDKTLSSNQKYDIVCQYKENYYQLPIWEGTLQDKRDKKLNKILN